MSKESQVTRAGRPLRGNALLQKHPLLKGERDAKTALRVNAPSLQQYLIELGEDVVDGVETSIRFAFEPTTAELLSFEDGLKATTGYLRARAVEGNFLAMYQAQAAALMNKLFTPIASPLHTRGYSRVMIFSRQMNEERFVQVVRSQIGDIVEHDEIDGLRISFVQIVAIVVRWPNCGTLRGLVNNILIAVDQAMNGKLFSMSRLRGVPRRSPEAFVQVILQLCNVGMVYVHGVNSDNVRAPASNPAFSFLAQIPNATGIPVQISGSVALLNHLRNQPAAADELLHEPPFSISAFPAEESGKIASAYHENLPTEIQEMLCSETIREILDNAGFQRRFFVDALVGVVDDIMTRGTSDPHNQLAIADKVLGRNKGLINLIKNAHEGKPIPQGYAERFKESLPISTRVTGGKKQLPGNKSAGK